MTDTELVTALKDAYERSCRCSTKDTALVYSLGSRHHYYGAGVARMCVEMIEVLCLPISTLDEIMPEDDDVPE